MTPIPKKSFLIFSELNKHHLNLQRSGYCASKGVLHAGTKPCLFAARQVPEFVPLSPMIHCSFFRRRVIQSPDGGNGFQFWWLILMGKPETCLERPWPQKHLLRHGRHGWWSDQECLTNVCVCVCEFVSMFGSSFDLVQVSHVRAISREYVHIFLHNILGGLCFNMTNMGFDQGELTLQRNIQIIIIQHMHL